MENKIIKLITDMCKKVSLSLGKGYTENIYQNALCAELREHGVKYTKEQMLPIMYEEVCIGALRMDINLPIEKLVIECKSIDGELREAHLPQIITYMKELNYNQGIYVNFVQTPSRQDTEIYVVTRQIDKGIKSYIFRKVESNETLRLTENGNKMSEFDPEMEIEWITKHITSTKEDHSFLSKQECKEAYEKLYTERRTTGETRGFIEKIEEYCHQQFKDRQHNGIKYKSVIENWKLVLN